MTIKGFKYRIYPNATQERELDFMLWKLRNLWNRALGVRYWHYNRYQKDIKGSKLNDHFGYTLPNRFPDTYGRINANRQWAGDAVRTPYGILGSMDKAFETLYRNLKKGVEPRKAGFPKFKRRGEEPGMVIRSGVFLSHSELKNPVKVCRNGFVLGEKSPFTCEELNLKGQHLQLKGLSMPDVRIHMHRPFPTIQGQIQYATITRDRGQWYISFTVKDANPEPVWFSPDADTALGIDVGLRYLISSSDGRQESHRLWYTEGLPALRRLQRKLDRQRRANNPQNYDDKGRIVPREQRKEWHISNNMRRTEKAVAQQAKRVQDQRRYFWETYTDDITKHHSIIVIENLTAKFLLSNKRLSRLSADAALSFFRTRLEHKCKERGVMLIRVHPAYTSQQCYACGHTAAENRLTQSRFVCVNCGHQDNADMNATYNIRDRGLRECEKAETFLRNNPAVLREIAEAKDVKRTSEGYLKESGVHHWTTLQQVAAWICSA